MSRSVMVTGQGREGAPPPAVQRVLRRMIDSGPSLASWRGSEWAAIPGRGPPLPLDAALKARTRHVASLPARRAWLFQSP